MGLWEFARHIRTITVMGTTVRLVAPTGPTERGASDPMGLRSSAGHIRSSIRRAAASKEPQLEEFGRGRGADVGFSSMRRSPRAQASSPLDIGAVACVASHVNSCVLGIKARTESIPEAIWWLRGVLEAHQRGLSSRSEDGRSDPQCGVEISPVETGYRTGCIKVRRRGRGLALGTLGDGTNPRRRRHPQVWPTPSGAPSESESS